MNACAARLRLLIVMLAWLAQALLPVAHAATAPGTRSADKFWCGEHASAMAALAVLPAELRAALDPGDAATGHLAHCSLLCAVAGAATLPTAFAAMALPRAAQPEPARTPLSRPVTRPQNPKPPAQAPPAHADGLVRA